MLVPADAGYDATATGSSPARHRRLLGQGQESVSRGGAVIDVVGHSRDEIRRRCRSGGLPDGRLVRGNDGRGHAYRRLAVVVFVLALLHDADAVHVRHDQEAVLVRRRHLAVESDPVRLIAPSLARV